MQGPARGLIVASNRGPVSFVRDAQGNVEQRRGVGGLVTAVGGALHGREAAWVATALNDEEQARAEAGAFPLDLDGSKLSMRFAAFDAATFDSYYNDFSNRVLWFLHHYLWETAREPTIGIEEVEAWYAYGAVNDRFASLMAEEAPDGAVALPQDYHLSLVPGMLRAQRPDLRTALFWHIPFSQPDEYRVLPDEWAAKLLEGMLGADVIGFQTERWAHNFLSCCRDVLGARVRGRTVTHKGHTARAGIYPVGVNVDNLRREAAHPRVAEAAAEIDALAGDRTLLLRVDRTELSKNILRGLIAYERLLERRRDLHGRVIHLALLTPSRRDVAEYRTYIDACTARADRINERFATSDWQPLVMDIADDFHRTLAAYRRYDVLVVNPVFDGMNLVAREGPLLNERDGVLVLSRNAGAAVELGPAALVVNPFDGAGTCAAFEAAIDMTPAERADRARRLVPLARGTTPERWLDRQISDASRSSAS